MRPEHAADLARERADLRRRLVEERGLTEAEAADLVARGEHPQVGLVYFVFHPGIAVSSWRIAAAAAIALAAAALLLWS